MQPGDTITPQGSGNPEETPKPPAPSVDAQTSLPPENSKQELETPQPAEAEIATPWQYNQSDSTEPHRFSGEIEPVTWSASEFVDHEKNMGWYAALAGISLLAVGIIYLLTQDFVTVVVVGMAAVLFAVTAKRKPRTLQYNLDTRGITIGDKGFPYETFKSFSVLQEGAFNSIQLMPLKRFMTPISLYFPPESEDKIVNTLASYLPHEERTHDPVERLMRRVRF